MSVNRLIIRAYEQLPRVRKGFHYSFVDKCNFPLIPRNSVAISSCGLLNNIICTINKNNLEIIFVQKTFSEAASIKI